jgi:hypothetical protein
MFVGRFGRKRGWVLAMPQHSQEVVERFGQQCIWAHQSWQTRKYLFDNESNISVFQQPHYEHFFLRLSIILQEYWMQQVAKLHDPAGDLGKHNLTVDYMIEYGEWDGVTKAQLSELRDKMKPFATTMKKPRNKLLSHNDLATILSGADLGNFDKGSDVEYFNNLKLFAGIVFNTILSQHFENDDAVYADVALFIKAFDKGRIGSEREA